LALSHGLRACWSTPIFDEQRHVLGTFALYSRNTGRPTDWHRELVDLATQTAAIAISGNRRTEALRASEERLRLAVSGANLGIWEWDLASDRLIANDRFKAMLGWPAEASDLTRDRLIDGIDTEDRARVQEAIQRSLAEHTDYDIEYRVLRPDGSLHWIAAKGRGQYDASGKPVRMLGVWLDITDRKHAQEETERRGRQLAEGQRIAQLGSYEWDIAHDKVYQSEELCRIFGARPEEFKPTFEDHLERIHPEERSAARRILKDAFRTGQPFDFEESIVLPDGTVRLLRSQGKWTLDKDKRPVKLIGTCQDITERKKIEHALKKSEREFRAIFDRAPLGIAVIDSTTGRFRKVNQQYCSITGYSEGELLTLTFQSITHPDDLQKDLDGMEGLLDGTLHTHRMEKRYFRKDGPIVWVSLTCVPLWEAPGTDPQHMAMVEDITDRRQAEDRLEESERKYRMLVEHANSIILRWNSEGRIIFLNEFGQRFFGYSEEEVLGHHVIGTIVPRAERTGRDLRRLMDQICKDPKAFEQNVNENMRRNGERVWIAWANRVVWDAHGQVAEILSVGTDITARRQAEEEVRRLHEDLQRYAGELERRVAERTTELAVARDHAEAADRLKSAFLATMSHELRTPLNSIIGFTGTVLQGLAGPLNDEQMKQLGMVQSSARHLLTLINEVLDISKIEAGQLEITCGSFSLPQAIQKAVFTVLPLAQSKGISVSTAISPEVGTIHGDQRRTEQILLNLLVNAVKFTEQGEVAVRCWREGGWLVTSVRDTGIGIDPQHIQSIFQPFRQVDTGLARKHEGTGLGLSICKRLVDRLGGSILVESLPGRGSTFTIKLPLKSENSRE
jgi:PAS domain S-box-containing protein